MKDNKRNEMSLDELLKEAHQVHFDICQICNTLIKQSESSTGFVLKTLRDLRMFSKRCENLDKRLRVISVAKSKEIHEINSKKWSEKDKNKKS